MLHPAFKKKIVISVPKYNDLVIPIRYHAEFLAMSGRTNVNDTLGETDDEDEESDVCSEI